MENQSSAKPSPVLSRLQLAAAVSDSIRMLQEITNAVRGVLADTPANVYQAVFIHDKPVAVSPLPDPQSRPRGRAHPLVALFKLGVTGARLMKQLANLLVIELAIEPTADTAATATELDQLVQRLGQMARGMGVDPGEAA